jgi:beta-lactamase regulating signal transducer with metallopeptidase domain
MTETSMVVLLLKASVLLAIALLVFSVRRHGPAVARHRAWSIVLAALLVLPAFAIVLPTIRIPVPAWRQLAPTPTPRTATDGQRQNVGSYSVDPRNVRFDLPDAQPAMPGVGAASNSARGSVAAGKSPISAATILVSLWLAGVLFSLGALVVALIHARRLASSGTVVADAEWVAACRTIAHELEFSRDVRLIASASVTTPMAAGVFRPIVFVPRDALEWTAERRDVVLAHEIAHLASRDPLRLLVTRLAFSVYWFHPLVWLAVRSAIAACEHACDEVVLTLGVRPSTYARVLLEFAEVPAGGIPAAALPIVRPALLETRLMAILSSRQRLIRRQQALPAVLLGLLALTVAAIQPAPSRSMSRLIASAPARTASAPGAMPAIEHTSKPKVSAIRTVTPTPSSSTTTVTTTIGAVAASACDWDGNDSRSFSGTISTTSVNGRSVNEQIGTRDANRLVQMSFGGLRVCAIAEGMGRGNDDVLPSGWLSRASRVVLETQQGGEDRRMEIAGGQVTWTINGARQAVDAAAQAWRDRLIEVLDPTWELSQLQGRVSTLRGQISTIYGQRSTLEGQISTLRGQVSTMEGQISTVRGEESSLRGEISSIQGHLSSLQGAISSEQGAISSLQASRSDPYADRERIDAGIRRHEDRIKEIQSEIRDYDTDGRVRDVQRRLDGLDTDGKVSAIEKQIRDFDVEGRVASVNRQIQALDVDGKVDTINRQITALDADTRSRDLETKRDAAVTRLRQTLGR